MADGYLLYYITDRKAFPGNERARRFRLLDKIAEAANAGVNYIQLREKDLSTRDLESLAREAAGTIVQARSHNREPRTVLLINSRADVALATGAAGVHLPACDISPADVQRIWTLGAGAPGAASGKALGESPLPGPLISISCHSPEEVVQAAAEAANLALFAPVFEKKDAPGTGAQGLDRLRRACRARVPVLALGGVTVENAQSCRRAGAAGIAAIRLFQDDDIVSVVRALRGP